MEETRKLKAEKIRAEKEKIIWKEKYKQIKKKLPEEVAGKEELEEIELVPDL
jgi:hypothetical protein